MKIKPYIFVLIGILLLSIFIFKFSIVENEILIPYNLQSNTEKISLKSTNFNLPPILEDLDSRDGFASFELVVKDSEAEFFEGIKTKTKSFGLDYLGPVIRVNRGDNVTINVKNKLREVTTTHWHGLKVDGDNDGGPNQIINPGEEWTANFVINQSAGTSWFHPHPHPHTGEQVYFGLAGLFLIDDKNSKELDLPKDYGVNDFPLIVQDRRFDSTGQLLYLSNPMDEMNGMLGNVILVNGVISSSLEIGQGLYRFRIVNGANARVFNFKLDNGDVFYQIATEGGFLEKPLMMSNLILSPGERAEIIINFSKYKTGESVNLISEDFKIIKFNIVKKENTKTFLPDKLAESNFFDYSNDLKRRYFELSQMGTLFLINNKQMDMNRIDEYIKLEDLEVWEIKNFGMGMMGGSMAGIGMNMDHSFHMHGVQFQIISRNSGSPLENEKGWKDTVRIPPRERVEVLVKFEYPGLFMYHCHFLEHEDRGMMGQFLVE